MCAMKTPYKLAANEYDEFMSLNSNQIDPIFIRQLDGMSMNVERFFFDPSNFSSIVIVDESVNFK